MLGKIMKLSSLLKQTNNNKVNLFVGTCLILAFVIRIHFAYTSLTDYYSKTNLYNSYEFSEFLINFHGGFVRRGLLGELLYHFFSCAHFPIISIVTVICYLIFFFVLIFFFYKFYKNKYCWWILLSPLFLGYTNDIVRKDYILYSILIVCLYLLHRSTPTIFKRLLAFLLLILGLFLHEAFIFWGFPIYALIILSNQRHKLFNGILISFPIAVFVLLSLNKGSLDIAHQIVDSWNLIIPGKPLYYNSDNSIGALGWDLQNTFMEHLRTNINFQDGGYGVILLPLFLFAGYYMFSNFLSVFSKKSLGNSDNSKLAISMVYSLLVICMIPMFTILSCDTGRNFQYVSVVTFATFLILPKEHIISLFPNWYRKIIIKFNKYIDLMLPPSKGLLIIMLLFIGMSRCSFSLSSCFLNSIIGVLYSKIIVGIHYIVKSIILIF